MAFPTTSVLDDFNRANEGPPPSASWTGTWGGGSSGLAVISNACGSLTSGQKASYWNTTYGPDSEIFFTTGVVGAIWMGARLTTPGAGTTDGYMGYRASGSVEIYRIDNDVLTALGAPTGDLQAVGVKYGFELLGSNLTIYKNTGGGWSSLHARSDSTYSSAGFIGLTVEDTTPRIDDFGGGTVSVEPGALGSFPTAKIRSRRTSW